MEKEPNLELLYRQGRKLERIMDPKRGQYGRPPAVLLVNPKYPHNVGGVLRACSCYGIEQLWYTGNRVSLEDGEGKWRLPREERMRGYADCTIFQNDRPFDQFASATPVAIEVRDNAENLIDFIHPENPVYVFGPEDGSLGQDVLHLCHRFVHIPTKHCTNLAAAVYTVLYDRAAKMRALVTA